MAEVATGAPEAPSSRPLGAPELVSALAKRRRIAIVPALNEEGSIGAVIDEIRAFDPGFEIVVVDDGSIDGTREIARARGVHVLRLPFNLGIGGAVQTGYKFAFERGYELAVQIDADGQHDPRELPAILRPVLAGEVDMAVGSRFAGTKGYRVPFMRRLGTRLFAGVISAIVRQRVTDTTSGFRAVNRRGIRLFAADYPHDYPEVEATVLLIKHRLRLCEVPVAMRERTAGRSSIRVPHSILYMVKVLLAVFVGIFRRTVPLEER